MVLIRPDEGEVPAKAFEPQTNVKMKEPKRILHFSDGVLEEYSTDEEDNTTPEQAVIDPSTLTWGPWVWYKMATAGSNTLWAVDKVGGFLASAFGVTTPRYYFELEEFKRREELKKKLDEEEKGWSKPSGSIIPLTDVSTKEPKPVDV